MLLKEPFLLREDTSGTKQETLYYLKNRGLSLDDLNVIAVMDDAASLIRCITLGMGISILSRATVQNDAQLGKLLIIPLEQSAFLRKLYIVYEHSASFDEAEGDISLYTFLPQSGGRHSRTRWGRLVSRKNTTSLR